MRLAILSDMHGNAIALEAVLADVEAQGGVEGYWVLGDLAALGPRPLQTYDLLRALPNAEFVRGNTDRYLSDGSRPHREGTPIALMQQLERCFAWCQGIMTSHLPFFDALDLEFRAGGGRRAGHPAVSVR